MRERVFLLLFSEMLLAKLLPTLLCQPELRIIFMCVRVSLVLGTLRPCQYLALLAVCAKFDMSREVSEWKKDEWYW